MLDDLAHPAILTPHPGEMARLSGCSTGEVVENRVGVAVDFARAHGVHLVLKGASTLVAHPDGSLWLNPSGNAGMATAGAGDVLTGTIGGLLALGVEPGAAARAGVFIHGAAGDLAEEETGQMGMIAGDILSKLPAVFRLFE
jgi:NAD(P)H-hydrate epimerase